MPNAFKLAPTGYVSQSARDAQDRGYGGRRYWDYLETAALGSYVYFNEKGDIDTARLMLTRSLSDALRGNDGD